MRRFARKHYPLKACFSKCTYTVINGHSDDLSQIAIETNHSQTIMLPVIIVVKRVGVVYLALAVMRKTNKVLYFQA